MEKCLECAKALLRELVRRNADFGEEVARGADEIMVLIGEAFDAKSCGKCSFGDCREIDVGGNILFARIFQGLRVTVMRTIATERAVCSMRSEQFEAGESVVDDRARSPCSRAPQERESTRRRWGEAQRLSRRGVEGAL